MLYVGFPGSVTDQLHGYVDDAQLSCERLPTRRIAAGLPLTQQIVNEIHHVTSGNWNTLVYEFATIAPHDVSFEMFHQTSGFGLQALGNGVHHVGFHTRSFFGFRPHFLPYRDHAYRFLDAFIDQDVVSLQHLIIQRDLGPVVEVLSIEDGLHLVVEGLHLLTYGVRWRRRRTKRIQQPRIHQGHIACVFHASTSYRAAPREARVERQNSPTALGRPIGNLRSDPCRLAVVTRGVFFFRQSTFVSETTYVTSSCIYSNDASVNRSTERSSLVCCRHTRLVHRTDRRWRWR